MTRNEGGQHVKKEINVFPALKAGDFRSRRRTFSPKHNCNPTRPHMAIFSDQHAHGIKRVSAVMDSGANHEWLRITLEAGNGETATSTWFPADADTADRFRKLSHYINLAFSHSAPSTAPELFEAVKLELVK